MAENVPITTRSTKIPVTHINQTHLDLVNSAIGNFCRTHKSYTWYFMPMNGRVRETEKEVVKYLRAKHPQNIEYFVISKSTQYKLRISINNGVVVSLMSGSYDLYGLYWVLVDIFTGVKVPAFVMFLRRYWLINLVVAFYLIPALIFFIMHWKGATELWLIGLPVILMHISARSSKGIKWSDSFLATDIQYHIYGEKPTSPFISFISSTQTMISLGASLATIVSFVIFLFQR
jgi:hypothetical protein